MRRITTRDGGALRMLFDRHAPLVTALGRRILRDAAEADALTTEVFWELWQRIDRYDARRATPLGYLILMTRSRAIDRMRSQVRHAHASLESTGVAELSVPDRTKDGLLHHEQASAVREALGRLSLEERGLIEHAFYEGMSHSQIADHLALPLGTVKSRIRHALIQLRSALRTYRSQDTTS